MANLFKQIKKISKDSVNEKPMHTGLVGEQLIISAYKSMSADKLEKLRYIMNKIINDKKRFKNERVNNSNNNNNNRVTDKKP